VTEGLSIRYFGATCRYFGLWPGPIYLIVRPTGLFGGAERGSARHERLPRRACWAAGVNVVYAYAHFCRSQPANSISGWLGFAAIGGSPRPYLSTKLVLSPLIAIPLAVSALVSSDLLWAGPGCCGRWHLSALATFALGEIVRATILISMLSAARRAIRLPRHSPADDRDVCARGYAAGVAAVCDGALASRSTAVHDDERVAGPDGSRCPCVSGAAFTLGLGHRRYRWRSLRASL